ncbi:MAG: hypothetical protein ACN6OU_08805 [Stenotrophomonas acidaminiphila]
MSIESKPVSIAEFNARFAPALIAAAWCCGITWLLSFTTSFFNPTASYWIGIIGLLITGATMYRQLFRASVFHHRAVGLALATAPFAAAVAIAAFPPLPFLPSKLPLAAPVAAVGLGLVIGWVAHALGVLDKDEPPRSQAV